MGRGSGRTVFAIYVRTPRQKLEADPEQPSLILTEQGVGYRLRAAD
jgi:two-component system, OmpR family, KDP operon response regulator KdpE